MPKFEIRMNCEYVLQVEAADEKAALEDAKKQSLSNWDEAWSEMEAEKIEE